LPLARRHGGDAPPGTLDFSAPQNPLGPPGWALEEAGRALGRLSRYPEPSYEKLRCALSLLHPRVDPGMVIPLNGAAEALTLALAALRPRAIAAFEPTFGDHALAAGTLGLRYEPIPLKRGPGGWRLDPGAACGLPRERLEGALVLVSNPNNPTGLHVEPRLLEGLAECLAERRAWLLVDEAFARLSGRPGWSLAGRAPPNTIVVGSLTKDLALPGIRLGYLVAHSRRVAALLEGARQPWNVNPLAAAVGEALEGRLSEFHEHLERARRIVAGEAPRILAALEGLGAEAWWGGAPYILVHHPGARHPGLNHELHRLGVHVRDASSFWGLSGEYSRIAVRLPHENDRLLAALRRALPRALRGP
jgi:threonine-phosphate decarboxylase